MCLSEWVHSWELTSLLCSTWLHHIITSESVTNPTNHATASTESSLIRSTAASSLVLGTTVVGTHMTSLVQLSIHSRGGTGNSPSPRVSNHHNSTTDNEKPTTSTATSSIDHSATLTAGGECNSYFPPSSILLFSLVWTGSSISTLLCCAGQSSRHRIYIACMQDNARWPTDLDYDYSLQCRRWFLHLVCNDSWNYYTS